MEPLQVIQLRGTEPLDLGPNEGKALYGFSTRKHILMFIVRKVILKKLMATKGGRCKFDIQY